MIFDYLQNNPQKTLRLVGAFNECVGHPSLPKDLLNIQMKEWKDDNNIVIILPEQPSCPAYFLPWSNDAGYYLTLPSNPGDRKLFITAELTGCCVGVQRMDTGDFIVRHYNVANESELDADDFQRYGDTFWLLPEKFREKMNKKNGVSAFFQHFYGGYNGATNPTVFWGEYEEEKKGWKFYYQTPDKKIHAFSPW